MLMNLLYIIFVYLIIHYFTNHCKKNHCPNNAYSGNHNAATYGMMRGSAGYAAVDIRYKLYFSKLQDLIICIVSFLR